MEWVVLGGAITSRQQNPGTIVYFPAYTALAYYELTTQVLGERIESIAKTRSYLKEIQNIEYVYIRIQSHLYFGFTKVDGLFIAGPEKPLADTIYLCSFGKYSFDFSALELEKFDIKSLFRLLKIYPSRTQNWVLSYLQKIENFILRTDSSS